MGRGTGLVRAKRVDHQFPTDSSPPSRRDYLDLPWHTLWPHSILSRPRTEPSCVPDSFRNHSMPSTRRCRLVRGYLQPASCLTCNHTQTTVNGPPPPAWWVDGSVRLSGTSSLALGRFRKSQWHLHNSPRTCPDALLLWLAPCHVFNAFT